MKSRLEVVRRWMAFKERGAASVMDAARQQHDLANEKTQEILVLRDDYRTMLKEQVERGANAEQLRGFQQFLGSLEAALVAQQARLTAEAQTYDRSAAHWIRLHRDGASVDKLIESRAAEVRRQETKTANRRATDQNAFARRFDDNR